MGYSELRNPYPYPEGHKHHDPRVNRVLEEHEEQWGNFNATPPGWREITEEEFVRGNFFLYSPEKVEYRQLVNADIKSERGSPLAGARLYFFRDGSGVAMMDDHWAGKIRFFAFGCKHKYRSMTKEETTEHQIRLIGCDHAYVCDECGHWKVIDSSG